MNDLTTLRTQIARGRVTFRINGMDEHGGVTHWVEVDAVPKGVEWSVKMTAGNGVERIRSVPSEMIEVALTELLLTIRSKFVQLCPHGVS
jgi:hypothetical protein